MSLYLTELKIKTARDLLDTVRLNILQGKNSEAFKNLHAADKILYEIINRPEENNG